MRGARSRGPGRAPLGAYIIARSAPRLLPIPGAVLRQPGIQSMAASDEGYVTGPVRQALCLCTRLVSRMETHMLDDGSLSEHQMLEAIGHLR